MLGNERDAGDLRQKVIIETVPTRFEREIGAIVAQTVGQVASGHMEPLYRDPQHWRDRAASTRAVAEQISDPESKRLMLEIVDQYEKLAQRAQVRAGVPAKSK